MKRCLAVAVALLALVQPAAAQNFFERLFGVPPQPQPPIPQPQYRPQPQRRAPTQPQQPQQQQRSAPAKEKEQKAEPAAPVEPPPAPYEKDLLRLAEIMGSLALLRPLCAAPDAGEWQTRMQTLLDAEGTTPGRRERLAGAYNKGYQSYALTYRVCTASAQEASNRYLREGETLSRNITSRYGG
ncbi:TIGR02301 family protein [Microvirga rosea]|uniref:TIGR02301 family protein n=1 Tax=Microvirga rosea TaxID=2715425 RepID=UPI001D0BAF38|nr:TIGR02301 family protein [Microvirga rosea]MCB8820254.1 TIGR02301 family protein [Microvirga rosea]